MWEVFQLHLELHFPGLHQKLSDSQWRRLFLEYRGCSPAEIAKAVRCSHDEIFYTKRHLVLDEHILLEELLAERTRFKPAISHQSTSDALAKILTEADFARPVSGEDSSRFARPSRELFEEAPSIKKSDSSVAMFERLISLVDGKYSLAI